MKRNPTKFWTSMAMRLAIAAGTVLPAMWATPAKAIIVAASQLPTTLPTSTSYGTVTAVSYVNVDMIETETGTLSAVVYNAVAGGNNHLLLYLEFKDASGTYTDPVGPYRVDGYHGYTGLEHSGDVAIAHDGSGNNFKVAVIYTEDINAVEMRTFDVTINPTTTPVSITWPTLPGTRIWAGTGTRPHIDMIADETNTQPAGGSNYPEMKSFVATWIDHYTTPVSLYFAKDTMTSLGLGLWPVAVKTGNLQWSDVTAVTDFVDLPSTKAYIAYTESDEMHVMAYDYAADTTISDTMMASKKIAMWPRIEGFGHHTDPRDASWMLAAGVATPPAAAPPTPYELKVYTDVAGPFTPSSSYTSVMDNYPGGVAAGIGSGWGSNVGNDVYAVGYMPIGFSFLMSQFFRGNTTQPGPLSNHYLINNSAGPGTWQRDGLALASSSNTGYDLFSAWIEGSDVYIKYSGNGPQYKPTDVANVKNAGVQIYPNPAADILHIKGAGKAMYHVADMSGKTIANGTLEQEQVNLQSLMNGMYIINVTDESGATTAVKFSKQ